MSCSACAGEINQIGAEPAKVQWSVVRGDTANLRIEFFENDEVTYKDTDGWTFLSSVFNQKNGETYELETLAGDGYVDITALPEITTLWGSSQSSVVADLEFDLQVDIDGIIWTPVIGTICVIGDITRNNLG